MGGGARANSLGHSTRSEFDRGWGVSGAGIAAALNQWPLVAILWVAALIRIALLLVNLQGRYARLDYSGYYESAFAMRLGLDPYSINLAAVGNQLGIETGTLYHAADTPTFLALFEPLTLLSPRAAYCIWTALSAGAFIAALLMLLWRTDRTRRPTVLALAAFAVMYPPLMFNFFWGQSQPIALFLIVLAMVSLGRHRDALAGISLAAAGLLRAFPMLLAGYLLLRGRWRAALWMGIGLAVGGVATLAVVGMSRCVSYVANLGWVTGYHLTGFQMDIALGPFVSRLFWYVFGRNPAARIELIRKIAVWIARAGVLALTMLATPIGNARDDRDDRAFSLWAATAIFLSPIAWPHYMVLLLIPFINMARAACAGRVGDGPLWTAAANVVLVALWLQFSSTLEIRFYAGSGSWKPLPLMLIAEGGFVAMMLGYAAAYWFAIDRHDVANAQSIE